jgi:hypothetical protein
MAMTRGVYDLSWQAKTTRVSNELKQYRRIYRIWEDKSSLLATPGQQLRTDAASKVDDGSHIAYDMTWAASIAGSKEVGG